MKPPRERAWQEKSIRNRFDSVVTVPTDDRETPSPPLLQCDGGRQPVMSSTFGARWQQQPAGVRGDGLK